MKLEKTEALIASCDVIFAALPHGTGEGFAAKCFERGVPYIDLSADFRFDIDEETYSAWYGIKYVRPDLHRVSVYGLPELNREKIKACGGSANIGGVIIGNPGCYPTAASLAAYPALSRGVCGDGTIVVDAASGITGGGREPARSYHFPECSDSMTAYAPGSHRHTPEISRNFSFMEGIDPASPRSLVFTPRLAPMNRGILCVVCLPLSDAWRCGNAPTDAPFMPNPPRPPSDKIKEMTARVRDLYAEFYKNEPFVRVLPENILPATGRVRHSNFCDISVRIDQNGANLIAVSAIDNMVKGAAGQAVQNMNIVLGFEEDCGLNMIPALF
jgi:N-acetyl-gamma-glutamyl-phosphate reductase